MALARVAGRVAQGGHSIPDDVVRRRYDRGLKNFFTLYRPVVDAWRMYDNSSREGYKLIASELKKQRLHVAEQAAWNTIVDTGT